MSWLVHSTPGISGMMDSWGMFPGVDNKSDDGTGSAGRRDQINNLCTRDESLLSGEVTKSTRGGGGLLGAE